MFTAEIFKIRLVIYDFRKLLQKKYMSGCFQPNIYYRAKEAYSSLGAKFAPRLKYLDYQLSKFART